MYCVPQVWKSTELIVTDHALIKERSLTLKRKKSSIMFDGPALGWIWSLSGAHWQITAGCHTELLRDLWHHWLLWGNNSFVLSVVRVERCQSVPWGPWGQGGVISDSFFGTLLPVVWLKLRQWMCCFCLHTLTLNIQASQPIHFVPSFSSSCWNERKLKTCYLHMSPQAQPCCSHCTCSRVTDMWLAFLMKTPPYTWKLLTPAGLQC